MNRKHKVLLVYPGDKSAAVTYPLGLLYVAGELRKIGVEVSFFYQGLESIKNLKQDDYLFVGISMLTGQMILNGLKAAEAIKKYNRKIPVVLGGAHPSLLPEQTLKNNLVDIVVIGEGEKTAAELALCLMNGNNLSSVQGIAYKDENKKIVVNPPREFMDLNELDYDLPYELLGSAFANPSVMPVHTSRGCPYRCSFCYSTVFNKRRYRTKTADRVLGEIEFLIKKYNVRNFNFDAEDEFFIDVPRALEIFRGIIDRKLNVRWTAFCRFDTFDRAHKKYGAEFLDLIKNSGCYYISFGAESGSQRLLDGIIRKDIKVEQIINTVEALKSGAIRHRVTFINCWPGETAADSKATFEVIEKISAGNPYILAALFNLCPYPGTEVYDILLRDWGCKFPGTLEEWGRYNVPIPLDNITWFPKSEAADFYRVAQISAAGLFFRNFASYKEYRDYLRDMGTPAHPGYIGYLVTKMQNWRFRKKFFRFMFEAALFTKALRASKVARSFLVNSVLKRYLPRNMYSAVRKRFGPKDWTNPEH